MVLFLQRLLLLSDTVGSIRGIGCVLFIRRACFLSVRKRPSPFPIRVDQVLSRLNYYVPHSSFRSEEGWVAPYYPRWASTDVPRELQTG